MCVWLLYIVIESSTESPTPLPSPPLPSMQDPTKDGEERIKADFAALNESLLEAFRKLEEA